MRIEIYSDTVCPWCFVGKRRLERALQLRPLPQAEIVWRPFQLNPNMPADGMERSRYLALKFGSSAKVAEILRPVEQAARDEGIAIDFTAIRRTPSTLASHRLIDWAQQQGHGTALVEALFRAYFVEGRDIGDRDVLVGLAAARGLPAQAAADLLAGSEGLLDVLASDARAREMGIQGVPTFVFDGRYAISGAHPPEVLLRFFDLATVGQAAPGYQASL